jgi:hypothetical protein
MVWVAMFAVAVVGATAIPAGAADAPSAKFCSAYAKISGASGNNGNSPTPKQAGALVARFKAAAQQAPPNVKAAGNTIVSVLSKIAKIKPTSAGDLAKFYSSADFRKYGQAIGTFYGFAGTCTTS